MRAGPYRTSNDPPDGSSQPFIQPWVERHGLEPWLSAALATIIRPVWHLLVAQGVGVWIGFQAFINMGVNLGALPTKGLTLPLMSYGGSAVLMNVVAIAVVLRIDYENRTLMRGGRA